MGRHAKYKNIKSYSFHTDGWTNRLEKANAYLEWHEESLFRFYCLDGSPPIVNGDISATWHGDGMSFDYALQKR